MSFLLRILALSAVLAALLAAAPAGEEEIISNYLWSDGRRYDYASCVDLNGAELEKGGDVRICRWTHSLPLRLGDPDLRFTRALLVFEAAYPRSGDVYRGRVGDLRFRWTASAKNTITVLNLPSPGEHASFWKEGPIDVVLTAPDGVPDGLRVQSAKLLLRYKEIPDPVLDPALRPDVAMALP